MRGVRQSYEASWAFIIMTLARVFKFYLCATLGENNKILARGGAKRLVFYD
jgi:hypothetical protein